VPMRELLRVGLHLRADAIEQRFASAEITNRKPDLRQGFKRKEMNGCAGMNDVERANDDLLGPARLPQRQVGRSEVRERRAQGVVVSRTACRDEGSEGMPVSGDGIPDEVCNT
jgi:hypothetical protein